MGLNNMPKRTERGYWGFYERMVVWQRVGAAKIKEVDSSNTEVVKHRLCDGKDCDST